MKTIRLILLLASLAGLASLARAAESVTVRGLLVSASNEPGESDPRLSAYLANLRRILRAENFRLLGEDSATLAVATKGDLSLGGQSVQLSAESADGKGELDPGGAMAMGGAVGVEVGEGSGGRVGHGRAFRANGSKQTR